MRGLSKRLYKIQKLAIWKYKLYMNYIRASQLTILYRIYALIILISENQTNEKLECLYDISPIFRTLPVASCSSVT